MLGPKMFILLKIFNLHFSLYRNTTFQKHFSNTEATSMKYFRGIPGIVQLIFRNTPGPFPQYSVAFYRNLLEISFSKFAATFTETFNNISVKFNESSFSVDGEH